jgi:2,4-dienoyl-CoA reductase-like NADH-dependent reductase (Old Yellow Enzyme family)
VRLLPKVYSQSNSNLTFKSVELTSDNTVTAQLIEHYVIKTLGGVGILIAATLTSTPDGGER